MPILYEEINFQNAELPRLGWFRTALLATGAGLGVVSTAALIHVIKSGKPGEGIKGWPRTLLLAGGACAGTLLTAEAIHLMRQAAAAGELGRKFVEET